MKFGYLLAVKDINTARKFYEELFGLSVVDDFGINISFDCGLCLQQDFDWLTGIPKAQMKERENNCEVYFEIMDFDGFLEKLRHYGDITFVHDVKEASWGQRGVLFYDLDNHLVDVGESLKSVIARFSAEGMSKAEVAKRMDITESDIDRILSEAD